MKKNLLIIIFILPLIVQGQLSDNFSDGNFTSNPSWVGDGSQYTVNGSQQLQLNSVGAGQSFLAVGNNLSSLDTTEWRFWIRLAFAPSSSNYARVYLASDQSNLEGPLNGYYLQFGESLSNDAIELFRQSGTTSTSVCRGTNAQIAAAFAVGVKVTRDAAGLWSLFVDVAGGTNYVLENSGIDLTFHTSGFFGVVCTYTTSNATNFFFDDFFIPFMPDLLPPAIAALAVVDSVHLDVRFSEGIDQLSSEIETNYSVNNSIGNPVSALRDAADLSLVHLLFSTPFSNGVTNTITFNNINDIAGNTIASNSSGTFTYYKPELASAMDIVINEVLFNARTGGVEFIEIYNRSEKVIDLKKMSITKEDLTTHTLDPSVFITTSTHLFLPGEYLVLSDDFTKVKSEYVILNPNAHLDMLLPDLLTEEDIILIQDTSGNTVDELHYLSSWHFPLLNDVDGVSLERLHPDRTTQDQSNWHSAAESAGFATPGYKNSEYVDSKGDGSVVSVDPEIFSPDNDGHNDVVNVHYHFENPGNVANVIVYDSKGRLVRNLVNNVLIGNDGSFVWDGVTNDYDKARIGMYIFYVEVFDLNGNTKSYKKTCVLASKL